MKMIAWNCQGLDSVTFCNHAYELHRRHRPQILIIVEPRIVEERAQAVINTLPYTHSWQVDPTGGWISRFSLNLGLASNNMVELVAVRQGLEMAWNMGFKFI